MAITHTIEVGKKSKKRGWKTFTPEERKEYWKKKTENLNKEKLDFVKSLISYAKENKRFPWEEPNFIRMPKSLARLEEDAKYNEKHPENPRPRSHAKYLGMNVLRLCKAMDEHGFKDSRWVSIETLKKKKLCAKRSEWGKGTKILAFNPKGRTKTVLDPKTGERVVVYEKNKKGEYLLDEKGKKIPEKEPTWTLQTVFNVEQVEGLNLEPEPPMKELDTTEKNQDMETIIAHSEAKVIHDQYGGDGRYYSPMKDEVHLPPVKQFKSMSAYYATAAHEIGHSTGHEKRLNRDMTGSFGSKSYAREELVAELTSVFLSQELDVKIPQKELNNHAEYMASWNEKINVLTEKPEELLKIISDAQKATNYIRDHMLEKYKEKDKEQGLTEEAKAPALEKEPPLKENAVAPKVIVPTKSAGKDMGR